MRTRRAATFCRGFRRASSAASQRMRDGYHELLAAALDGGPRFAALFLLAMAATALLAFPFGPLPGLGQDFFPSVDAGQIKLHLRARTGTRIEETAVAVRCDRGDDPRVDSGRRDQQHRRQHRPALQRHQSRLQHLGAGGTRRCGHIHQPRAQALRAAAAACASCARHCRATYPSTQFAFLPADIVSQILNFGLPAPHRRAGRRLQSRSNRAFAHALLQQLRDGCRARWTCTSSSRTTIRRSTSTWTAARPQLLGLTRAGRRLEPAGLAVGQLPDLAVVLDRPEERALNTTSRRRRRSTGWHRSTTSAIRR